MTIASSSIAFNIAKGGAPGGQFSTAGDAQGGGIQNFGGTDTVVNSTIASNHVGAGTAGMGTAGKKKRHR